MTPDLQILTTPPPFSWTKPKELAAALVAADALSDEDIGVKCGVSRQTLACWKKHPEFAGRVREHVEAFRASVRARGIAVLENRVHRLNADWQRMQALRAARATDLSGVPGGETGLLVRREKMIGSGVMAERVEEYEFDAALLRELRAHEEQAAKELGQWTDKTELSGNLKIERPDLSDLADDDLDSLETILAKTPARP